MTDQRPVQLEAEAKPYEGAVCPGCGKIAYPFKGGHDSECEWRKRLTPVEDS